MVERVDVVVVGGGPAGSVAARAVAEAGAQVLLVEARPNIGLPVQCAEYVPARLVDHVDIPPRCIAQRISALHTHLPDGQMITSPAPGFVLVRACFDKALAVAARCAGAAGAGTRLWAGARVMARTPGGVLIRQGDREVEVLVRVIIGADGPRSTVGKWIGASNTSYIDALQVEAVLSAPMEATQVYFHPLYRGGYGWCFPKGETANIGVGVSRALGGEPRRALAHLLSVLGVGKADLVGHTAGPVPSGGPVAPLAAGGILLVGDAAGLTHPITGAGILHAVISGALAGRIAAQAALADDPALLDTYQKELDGYLGGPLRHALAKRQQLDAAWSDDPHALSRALRETWIAFRAYGRRHEGGNAI